MTYEHQIKEHERPLARALWEQIFPEDTQAFLDAFFALKGDNVILGITEREAAGAAGAGRDDADRGTDGAGAADTGSPDRLAAMIHLDPCRLVFGRKPAEGAGGSDGPNVIRADYIVGVSTLPAYRHRGLMASLLAEAFAQGAARKDPFIFLMPANEQVYLPFDFRTVYLQTNWLAADAAALAAAGRIAGPEDCAALAEAVSRILEDSFDMYLVRDERYFRELIEEMGAEDGKVLCLPAKASDGADPALPAGYLCFWPNDDGGALVRELVCPDPAGTAAALGLRPIADAAGAAQSGPGNAAEEGPADPHGPTQPQIMVRALDPAEFVRPLRCDAAQTFTITYHDAILDMYDGVWSLTVGPEGGSLVRADETAAVCGTAKSSAPAGGAPAEAPMYDLDPASLAEWVFGVRELPGITGIRRPDRILINEWI